MCWKCYNLLYLYLHAIPLTYHPSQFPLSLLYFLFYTYKLSLANWWKYNGCKKVLMNGYIFTLPITGHIYFLLLFIFLNHLIFPYFLLASSRCLSLGNYGEWKLGQWNFRLWIWSWETCATFCIVWPGWIVAGPEQKMNPYIHVGIDGPLHRKKEEMWCYKWKKKNSSASYWSI